MKISIVIPVYDASKYIDRCLISCFKQEFCDFEIIAVDDCGKDDSFARLCEWSSKDARLKIVRNKKNLGTYHARRVGVENACGDYVFFLDPDDEVASMDSLYEVDSDLPEIVFFKTKVIPGLKIWQSEADIPNLGRLVETNFVIDEILRCKRLSYGTEGKLIRRDILLKAYDLLSVDESIRLVYSEDILLFFAVMLNVKCARSVPVQIYIYHKNPMSITVRSEYDIVVNKLGQLDKVLSTLLAVSVQSPSMHALKARFVSLIELNKLRLLVAIGKGWSRIIIYLKILSITKSFKDLVRLFVYIVTIGKVAL